ncbi:hypothetical protein [Thalassoroseus pseudoceratinae]|uniref:hypothetical protein n=1 Tax=Thalassoroseus pseudoceratinae TaxID=2713176 RepID=UPI00142415E0|nr:hypothetical protein [Thalassoroseus pseudoceratinae]
MLDDRKIQFESPNFSAQLSLGSSSLTTKALCRRHNTALSPIDSAAARFFRAFTTIHNSLCEDMPSQQLYFFSGMDIERWMLKTMIMVYKSKQTNICPPEFELPPYIGNLFYSDYTSPLGLYMPTFGGSPDGSCFRTESATSVQLHASANIVSGVTITLGGLRLRLVVFPDVNVHEELKTRYSYRPKHFLFVREHKVHCIAMPFPNWHGADIWLSHGEENATIPYNL